MDNQKIQNQRIESTSFIAVDSLIDRYDCFFLDAFGVLVNNDGGLPYASAFIHYLQKIKKPFYIVTNGSSRLPKKCSLDFKTFGFDISEEQIITSGSVLKSYFAFHQLQKKRFIVVGNEESKLFVEEAGGKVLSLEEGQDADGLIIMAQPESENYLAVCEQLISYLFTSFDKGTSLHLLSTNPDLIYPNRKNQIGFTVHSVVLLMEEACKIRYQEKNPCQFIRLGKPAEFLFKEAADRAKVKLKNIVMIGDQLHTDIAGANHFGIDSALIMTGLTKMVGKEGRNKPTYLLKNLEFHNSVL